MMDDPNASGDIGKLDRRLTGASNIDEQLQEVLDLVFRDYIDVWCKEISNDNRFHLELRKIFNISISNFASRAKEVDWTPFLTQTLVDEIASHVKLYRRAQQKYHMQKRDNSERNEDEEVDIIDKYFFEFETEMEGNVCRESVSSFEDNEKRYLQDMVEAILFFLLPDEVFDQKMFRFLVREVLVYGVIYPTIDRVSESDYVNQLIVWMCEDSTLTSETFLTTLKMSKSIAELQCVLAKVKDEMSRVRAKDTGGADDSTIKQKLSSLAYLERICQTQITRIAKSTATTDSVDCPADLNLKQTAVKQLPFVFVFANDLGIQYFNDYLITNEKEIYLNILLDIECFHKLAIPPLQGTGDKDEAMTFALSMVNDIHDKYFAENVPNLQVDAVALEPVHKCLTEKRVTGPMFDALHDQMFEKLEKFYEEFRRHDLYHRMLRDLDLDVDSALSEESYDVSNSASSASEAEHVKDTKITATIIQTEEETGIVKDKSAGGKSYALYSVQVTELSISTGVSKKWQTTRRYSDFYDLYTIICDKHPPLRDLPFPGKRTFNNMNKEFLEKRANSLIAYMQNVLESDCYSQSPGLRELMSAFLHTEIWDKPKGGSVRRAGALVNPLRVSVRQMGSKVRAAPDALFGDVIDGFGKLFTKLSLAPTLGKNQLDSIKVGATLDTEDDDNIPMRIMLLLLDEVFDLRKKNQWLRRRIVAILRQIVKATYGDKINRRIVDHVEMLTSSDQVAEYIKQLKERLWPSGIPAEPSPPRDRETKLRTAVVSKAKMIGSVPDELRHMIGTETTRAGVLRVFSMCQHKRLNKRLIFVIIEGILQTVFPQNNFEKVFRQIHTTLQRGRADSSLSQSSA